ncbi:MAG TPA: DUF1232 domain-containing protein [bacterium]|nr:DUF1232 domain-containing protein [bacterium]
MVEKRALKVVYDDDFYQAIRRRIKEWAAGKGKGHKYLEFVLLAPDLLHLMVKLTLDRRVPAAAKAKLGFAIAYFISPLDLLPEAVLGPIGYLDDVAMAAWVIDSIIKSSGADLILEHWAGEADIIATVSRITGAANELLGAGLVRKLKVVLDRQHFGNKMVKEPVMRTLESE